MLAEMARAFNIGLGLNELGGANQTENDQHFHAAGAGASEEATGEGGRREGELPPEGSFDRFLVDLQADLRLALTREDEGGQQRVPEAQAAPTEATSSSTTGAVPEPSAEFRSATSASSQGENTRQEDQDEERVPDLISIDSSSSDGDYELEEQGEDIFSRSQSQHTGVLPRSL